METIDAIDQLAKWCNESSGAPLEIAPGRALTFNSHATFDEAKIRLIEDRLGFHLPDSYRRYMSAIGQSVVFKDPWRGLGGMYFFSPEEAVKASLAIWDGEEDTGPDRFCINGYHRSMGDNFGFAIDRTPPKNFDVFCHEYPPGQYVEISNELRSWRTFEEWIIRAVETYGKDTL